MSQSTTGVTNTSSSTGPSKRLDHSSMDIFLDLPGSEGQHPLLVLTLPRLPLSHLAPTSTMLLLRMFVDTAHSAREKEDVCHHWQSSRPFSSSALLASLANDLPVKPLWAGKMQVNSPLTTGPHSSAPTFTAFVKRSRPSLV